MEGVDVEGEHLVDLVGVKGRYCDEVPWGIANAAGDFTYEASRVTRNDGYLIPPTERDSREMGGCLQTIRPLKSFVDEAHLGGFLPRDPGFSRPAGRNLRIVRTRLSVVERTCLEVHGLGGVP
jgi:hypothetical protein